MTSSRSLFDTERIARNASALRGVYKVLMVESLSSGKPKTYQVETRRILEALESMLGPVHSFAINLRKPISAYVSDSCVIALESTERHGCCLL